MCEIKFLQICLFFTILTSLHFLNLSFPLLFYVISTNLLKFPPWFPASPPWPPPYFSHFHQDSSHSHTDFPHLHQHAILQIP